MSGWRKGWRGRLGRTAVRKPALLGGLAIIFVVSTVFDALDWTWLAGEGDTLSSLVGFVFLAAHLVLRGPRFSLGVSERRWFLAFGAWTLLTEAVRFVTLGPQTAPISFRYYWSYAQVFVLYLLLRDVMGDRRFWKGVTWAYIGSYLGVAFLVNAGAHQAYERATVLGRNSNGLAFSCGLAAVMLLVLLLTRVRIPIPGMMLGLGAVLLLLVAVVRTGSRGGALAVVVGIMVASTLTVTIRRFSRYAILVPLVVAGGVYMATSTGILVERVQMAIDGTNLGARPELAEASWELVKERPVVGIGPAYVWRLGEALGAGGRRAAHNGFLQIAISFGLPGLLLFLVFLHTIVRRFWQFRYTSEGALALTVFSTLMAFFLSSNTGYGKLTWVLLALVRSAIPS